MALAVPRWLKAAVALLVAVVVAARVRRRLLLQRLQARFLSFARGRAGLPPVGTVLGSVSALNVFPAKSCRAVRVEESAVTKDGFPFDRKVMIVNKRGVPVTQRMQPSLARVDVAYSALDNSVTMTAPEECNLGPLVLRLDAVENDADRAEKIDLHGLVGRCAAFGADEGRWVDDALSALSGRAVSGHRVVCLLHGETRNVHWSAARLLMDDSTAEDGTLLSDLAPISFASEASLTALNAHVQQSATSDEVPMAAFRPNLVMDGPEDLAFVEDHIAELQVGEARLRVIGPTFRCVIPSVDQETGEAGFRKDVRNAEPIATLKRLRSGGLRFGVSGLLPMTMGGSKGLAPLFGLYLGASDPASRARIRVGDEIKVLAYREPRSAAMRAFNEVLDLFGVGSGFLAE